MQTKLVSQASGSAYVELNNTKVMAAVYGPRQTERKFGFNDQGILQCEVRMTTCAAGQRNRGGGMVSVHERDMSAVLQKALEASIQLHKIPRSTVDVFCMVLEADGAEAAAAITAASLALADAGIELYDLVPAVSVALVGSRLLMDPSKNEALCSNGSLLLAHLPARNEVTQLVMKGPWQHGEITTATDLALAGCVQLRAAMRAALLEPSS